MGMFAQWQPAYDEAGIATFPVDGEAKKPLTGNYLRGGRPASRQWALKFPDANGLGFACGSRNGITVADIDAPSESLLADVLADFGPTPVVIRTASGKYHAWYRHNGEKRKIRSQGFSGPVDILGGGMSLAPPSRGSGGGSYEWLQGSLADIAGLPKMRQREATESAVNDVSQSLGRVEQGARNEALWRACAGSVREMATLKELCDFAIDYNAREMMPPLPCEEVARVAGSVWKMEREGRNGLAGDKFVTLPGAALKALDDFPDASYLYTRLRRDNWGRTFLIANGWAKTLPISLARLQEARRILLKLGLIVLDSPETRGRAALYRFSA